MNEGFWSEISNEISDIPSFVKKKNNDSAGQRTRAHTHTHTHAPHTFLNHYNVRRFVRTLYKILNPQCRHRTGSPFLMRFRTPQSPQRYSTPLINGIAPVVEVVAPVVVAPPATDAAPPGVFIIPKIRWLFVLSCCVFVSVCAWEYLSV